MSVPKLNYYYYSHQNNAKKYKERAEKILRQCIISGNDFREAGEQYANAGYYAQMGKLFKDSSKYFYKAYCCYQKILFKKESDDYKSAKFLCKAGKIGKNRAFIEKAISVYEKIEEFSKSEKYKRVLNEIETPLYQNN